MKKGLRRKAVSQAVGMLTVAGLLSIGSLAQAAGTDSATSSRNNQVQKRWLRVLGIAKLGQAEGSYSVTSSRGKQIRKGQVIFNENCSICHQEDAIGKPGTAPSLSNPELLSLSSNRMLETAIRKGRPGTAMAPFGDFLKNSEIKAVVSYLRSLATLPFRGEQVDAEPQAMGDHRFGEQWFHQICATCHGPQGNGYEAGGTGTAIGKAGFLDTVTDGFLRETIRKGRSNTRMLGFQGPDGLANLNDQEIDDIITYLRTVPSAESVD